MVVNTREYGSTMKNLEDSYLDALNLLWDDKYLQAFEILSYLSSEKYFPAYNELACLYESGFGVAKDYEQALFFYKKHLKHQKEPGVMSNLASLYLKMNNLRQAKYWWNKAIALGDGESALDYATHLIERKSKNVKKIKTLLIFASETDEMYMSENGRDKVKELLKYYSNR